MKKADFILDKTNVKAEFDITGDDFDPNVITKELSIIPSEAYRKGDMFNLAEDFPGLFVDRGPEPWKWSCWRLMTSYQESFDINDQLDQLLNVLSPKRDLLVKLKKELEISYSICIVVQIKDNIKPAMYLEKPILEFATYIDMENIGFDLYIYGNEKE
jgi:hypothetical protein